MAFSQSSLYDSRFRFRAVYNDLIESRLILTEITLLYPQYKNGHESETVKISSSIFLNCIHDHFSNDPQIYIKMTLF